MAQKLKYCLRSQQFGRKRYVLDDLQLHEYIIDYLSRKGEKPRTVLTKKDLDFLAYIGTLGKYEMVEIREN